MIVGTKLTHHSRLVCKTGRGKHAGTVLGPCIRAFGLSTLGYLRILFGENNWDTTVCGSGRFVVT